MKKLVMMLAVMMCAMIILSEKAFALPVDRYIGQITIWKEVIGNGDYEDRLFVLYPGDAVVMERNNISGKILIIGIYRSNANNTGNDKDCIIFLQKIEILSSDITVNVIINGERIRQCQKSAN
ncbi:MAG: hypothetical protein AAB596_00555 [Patescibacteria group bacterium]